MYALMGDFHDSWNISSVPLTQISCNTVFLRTKISAVHGELEELLTKMKSLKYSVFNTVESPNTSNLWIVKNLSIVKNSGDTNRFIIEITGWIVKKGEIWQLLISKLDFQQIVCTLNPLKCTIFAGFQEMLFLFLGHHAFLWVAVCNFAGLYEIR